MRTRLYVFSGCTPKKARCEIRDTGCSPYNGTGHESPTDRGSTMLQASGLTYPVMRVDVAATHRFPSCILSIVC